MTPAIAPREGVVELLARGMAFGPFAITGKVTSSKHASVFQAREPDGSFVALKLATSELGARLLARESRMLQAFAGGNRSAARFVAAGSLDGHPYLAMGWIHGAEARAAADELRNGAPSAMLGLCVAIAQAYAALHESVLHGRIHPRHLLIDGDSTVHVLDLSLAVAAAEIPATEMLSARFGMLSAPEQAAAVLLGDELPVTAAAEQYSIAGLLYLLVTGRMYARLKLERGALAADIIGKDPLAFTDQGVAAWPELEAVLRRALAKDPGGRFSSVGELHLALTALSPPVRARPPAAIALEASGARRALDALRSDADPEAAIARIAAPTCSINFGAAGVAFALTRLGKLTQDPAAFAAAERWLSSAELHSADADAFDDGDELSSEVVGSVSPFHNVSGVAAVRAFLSDATGDDARHQTALDDFRSATAAPCANLDLTLGRSSVLLFAALLLARANAGWPATRRLEAHGDELCAGIWRELTRRHMTYYGIAHGYAGVAYATMMWAQTRGVPPPAELHDVLEMLAAAAEPLERGARWPLTPPAGHAHDEHWPGWCHGNAGYVFLWNLAQATCGDRVFAELADRAARLLDHRLGVCSLCCGRAGQGYAALNHYRSTGEERWRSLAVEIASAPSTPDAQAIDEKNPLSLYKGEIGLALLAAELEQPDRAAMPLFEFEPAGWPAQL